MKTPEEIKKGLAMCSADECHGQHTGCPYHPDLMCIRNICADAIAMIKQLEAENAELQSTYGQVKKALSDKGFSAFDEILMAYDQVKQERDTAVNDLTESQFCHARKEEEK